MHVEQVRFRSGQVRCAADLYLPDGIDDQAPAPAVVMGHSVVMVKEALGAHSSTCSSEARVIWFRKVGNSSSDWAM